MLKNPNITVLMPVYNGEEYLREAIESILNQTYSNFEFIIINDGSNDSSEEIILSYRDERIRYIKK
jgi:glycosyltransferase involved in cell wall biosynthesis